MQTYSEIEGILLALLEYYKFKFERDCDPTGDAFALSVLEAFDQVENPLHSLLGTKSVEGRGSQEATVPIVRQAIDYMRQCRTWFRSQCLAKSSALKIVSLPITYKTYYSIVFGVLVECLGICVKDASKTGPLAFCTAKESGEQGIPGAKLAFTWKSHDRRREVDTMNKVTKGATDQQNSSSQATASEPPSIEELFDARIALEEMIHARLLGIPVSESSEAKATASSLPISDRLIARMKEVPNSRTPAWQQLQGPTRRPSTRPYRSSPLSLEAKSRDTCNAKTTANYYNLAANKATSLGGFSEAEYIDGNMKIAKELSASSTQAPDPGQAAQSKEAITKPHSARLKELPSTSLPVLDKDVRVQPEHLAEPAGNNTPLQEIPSDDASLYRALWIYARRENASLIQERDALKIKLDRASEDQAAAVRKAKADLLEDLRRGFNGIMDGVVRSA